MYENYNLAIGGSRNDISNSEAYAQSELFCFERPESIASYQVSFWMSKNNDLNSKINDIISKLFEAGLLRKWLKDSRKKVERLPQKGHSHQLEMERFLFSIYLIYLPCILTSCLTFCFEHLVNWNMSKSERHWIWTYCDQCCDGHRHYLQNLAEIWQPNEIRKQKRLNDESRFRSKKLKMRVRNRERRNATKKICGAKVHK